MPIVQPKTSRLMQLYIWPLPQTATKRGVIVELQCSTGSVLVRHHVHWCGPGFPTSKRWIWSAEATCPPFSTLSERNYAQTRNSGKTMQLKPPEWVFLNKSFVSMDHDQHVPAWCSMLNLRTLVIDINFPGTILVHHMIFSVRGSILGPFICPSAHCSGHGSQSMQNPNFNWNQSNTSTGIVLQNLSLVFVKSCVLSSKNVLDLASMTAWSRSILGGTDWDKAADALEAAAEPEGLGCWMMHSCSNKCLLQMPSQRIVT